MTSIDSLLDLHVYELAEHIARGEIGPVEVTEAVLGRIERVEAAVNAFVTVTAGEARAAAHAAEREIAAGHWRGPLHGVPVAVKDLCDAEGIKTTAGSPLLFARMADRDATVVRRMREAGAIIVGKLNLHEVALGVTGINPHLGAVRNPWDPARIAGGSSSGSAAAVAAMECFAALGSDTGGSIRIPASLCGVVGLKPTHGRTSLAGVFPLASTLDHVGPITRCVRDAALVLAVISGYDVDDPWSIDVPVEDYTAYLESGVRSIRVGVPSTYVLEGCDPDVAAAVKDAIRLLRGSGARTVEVDTGMLRQWWLDNMAVIVGEAAAVHRRRVEETPAAFGADVLEYLRAALKMPAYQYAEAARMRDALRSGRADETLFASADVLVMPATPVPALRSDEIATSNPVAALTRNTAPFDLSGQPAITVPCGLTSAGLPVGLQIVGQRWDEATVLRAARAYEAARGPLPSPDAG